MLCLYFMMADNLYGRPVLNNAWRKTAKHRCEVAMVFCHPTIAASHPTPSPLRILPSPLRILHRRRFASYHRLFASYHRRFASYHRHFALGIIALRDNEPAWPPYILRITTNVLHLTLKLCSLPHRYLVRV